ncbi:MAG: GAF domain-containing protein [Chloroflexota bacterium]
MKRPEQIDTPESELTSPQEWRNRFLHSLFAGAAIFGLIALTSAFFSISDQSLFIVYVVSYVILLAVIFIPFPYQVRGGVILFLLLAIGIGDILENGITSNADIYLLTFVAITTLLFSPRAGILAIAVSIATLIAGAMAILGGYYQLLDTTANAGNLEDWVSSITTQLFLSVIVVAGLRRLQLGFIESNEDLTQALRTLEEERTSLEQRVAERTKELEKKANQLNAAAYIAQQAAEFKDLSVLLPNVAQLISKEFGFYHAGIFLISEKEDYAVLQATSSEGGRRMIERGHRLRIGTEGIVGFVAAEKRPRIALDVGEDAVFFNNPELPKTRSEIAIPLIAQDRLIGVLDVQSTEPQAFNQDDVDILQTLADQIAVAIENVRLITESQVLIHELEMMSTEFARQDWQEQLSSKIPGYHYSQTGVRSLQQEAIPSNERYTMSIPILFRGQKIGRITLQRKPSQPDWTSNERQLANEIATQTALALDNARLIKQARESALREQAVTDISSRIRETLDLETVLRTAAQELQRALNLQEAEVRLTTPQDASTDSKRAISGGQTRE